MLPKFKEIPKNQLSIFPTQLDSLIPQDHICRAIDSFVEGLPMNLVGKYFLNKPSNEGGRPAYHPKLILKLLLYSYTTPYRSSHELEKLAKESIPCMWLLSGETPDHATISRFRSKYLKDVLEDIHVNLVLNLAKHELVNLEEYVLDGTLINANANKYKTVFKKNAERYSQQVRTKVQEYIHTLENLEKESIHQNEVLDIPSETSCSDSNKIKEIAHKIDEQLSKRGNDRVTKKQKTQCRNIIRKADQLNGYEQQLQTLDSRNSYSKTDTDATYMRMKNREYANGYNVQVGTSKGFITGVTLHQTSSDQKAFIPHVAKYEEWYGKGTLKHIVADGGYGSERTFTWMEQRKIIPYVKFPGYYQQTKEAYKKNQFIAKNMPYYEDGDYYLCPNDQKLEWYGQRIKIHKNGYKNIIQEYRCKKCNTCPLKNKCTTAEYRKIMISENANRLRAKATHFLKTEEGKKKSKMRGHDIETVFGHLKKNLKLDSFLLRGKDNVNIEMLLFTISYNLIKLLKSGFLLRGEQLIVLLYAYLYRRNKWLKIKNSSFLNCLCSYDLKMKSIWNF
ncbi:IS1182 family transposase [Flammeovirga sp. OC4]|uniref:IS1182 family transposase n=3 Tax=unclassified Flammeovirga TaxID=2637820 RepID=UPI0005C567B6|nr:IS1182 family transposase [Flammeovirga sp. OC4]